MVKLVRPVVAVLALGFGCGLLSACSGSGSGSASSSAASSSENPGQYVDSSRITAMVKTKLLAIKGIDSNDITVSTANGVVILTGVVDNQAQSTLAGYAAESVTGVTQVENHLKVKSSH